MSVQKTLRQKVAILSFDDFSLNGISIRPIRDDCDLWYAVVECRLAPGQEEYVNPAGFSIGRAYLHPESNLPCLIWKEETRIGYIVLKEWTEGIANSWSYYLDEAYQKKGYGRTSAQLAVQIQKPQTQIHQLSFPLNRQTPKRIACTLPLVSAITAKQMAMILFLNYKEHTHDLS